MTHLEVFIELVQNETHAIHQTVHICRLSFRVPRTLVRGERRLEFFEIGHPLNGKVVRLDISFVEYKDKGQFGLVQDTAVQVSDEWFRCQQI